MRWIFVVMTTSLLAGCANHVDAPGPREPLAAAWETERLAPQVYTPPAWPVPLEAIVHRPRDGGLRPAVLVVHGGGWARRSPRDMERVARTLASRGFVAVNVAYRLAPEFLYPAPLHDLRQALTWMAENAPVLRLDPNRMGALGYSAGAHLVSQLAVLESNGEPDWKPARAEQRLKAVVAGGLPADLTRWPKSPLVKTFLGAPLKEAPELWREASPVTHVTSSSPPFFLYHGGLDQLVEVEQAELMKQSLDEAGVHAELYTVPYHGHMSMFLLNRSSVRRAAEFLAETLD